MIGSSNDETDFPHKLLLTNTQVLKIRKVFATDLSTNKKFSKTQLSKFVQLGGGFIGNFSDLLDPDQSSIFNPLKTLKNF